MNWFAEDPLPIWLFGALALTCAAIVYLQTRKNWALLGVIGVLAIVGLLTLAERLIVTPREAVEHTLYAILETIESDDLQGTLAFVSSSATEVRADAESLMPKLDIIKARTLDLPVIEVQNEDQATATFKGFIQVKMKRSGHRGGYSDDITVQFKRENDHWLVAGYKPAKPIPKNL